MTRILIEFEMSDDGADFTIHRVERDGVEITEEDVADVKAFSALLLAVDLELARA